MKKREEKKILYEAWAARKYKNYNADQEEIDIGKLFFCAIGNICWFLLQIFEFLMTGVAIVVLANDSTRRALLQLFSDIKF